VAGADDHDRAAAEEDDARRVGLLYREHGPRLRRSIRGRIGSAEDARDLVQDAFARLLGAGPLGRLREPEAFLSRIVRNLLIDRARRQAVRPGHVRAEDEPLAVPADQDNALQAEQLRIRYEAIVAALPPRTRQVFLLHRVDELGYREIAERLGISRRTAEWHVAEAVLRIGRELDRE